ncbi:phosphate ABC transporter permease subunit PstC [Pacificibacter marinus]|uniref:Phosphate transport system permease protein n=1 Tax=Pacificibacter marinus TaxID=658057 RepID=A0A1Y5T6V7_9RHOB|nr:phosphate ABC transporter permease subunit PstC [Pacificibacter marinus]SEK98162.1 phosphate ABC transporter membrane protein 1, PhoT family [Pacificibacter marinus]SLN53882.1 Phosphate transport system permease protein PstC [Pacificibacter marinus]
MPALWLFITVLVLGLAGFILGRARVMKDADGDIRKLHSLPNYYGSNVMLSAIIPSLGLLVLWLIVQPMIIQANVASHIPTENYADSGALNLLMSDVRRVADGLDIAVSQGALTPHAAQNLTGTDDVRGILGRLGVALGTDVEDDILTAAQEYRIKSNIGGWIMTVAVIAAAILGFAMALKVTNKDHRARNSVEKVVLALLIGAASLAVLTTVGIVFSLIFNTIEFFKLYPAADFFFGTTWAPSFGGGSELGILPLFWGTFYISIISLLVAVPIGLFAAVYLSEYAGPKTRGIAKPLLEVLAGIPTIVYGLFALLTVGPLLVGMFGKDGSFGVNWMQGGSAVITAGLVMGVMLIPFISSLSDDIINSVPQSMRDGSLGLGATKSETIKQVILPAALPGIVGAILLAASRAIGETMIVVLGAGAAARLSMNPFEAMTTVTTRIVSQLTGDADFSSPEALVAFALGMTLFVITLCLNIVALVIVRKYREQYD